MALSREDLRKKFEEEYQRLNEKQREAVDHIEGPVMVIAGPGTGKTQILASRIGRILLDTDTAPENILCLTYTDAGAIAMRRRLLQFIGPDAYKVNISTFHAFCHEVIQANLHLFEKNTMDPMSELQQVELFKRLIDSFPRDHVLKRIRDPYYERPYLAKLFSAMKREGWKPPFLQERIKAYVEDLPNRDEYRYKRAYKGKKAGDLKEADYNEEVERMAKLSAAVGEFDRFQTMMRDRNLYDFDDMIIWVIDAFMNNPALKSRYQERFLYILVDEYQDTSGTQNRIVELLTDFWDQPNIFVVGDDDQSIYRFQGANIENMSGMFRYCRSLEVAPELNTSFVEDMSEMFYECSALRQVPLYDTSNVTTMESMFSGCKALETIPAFDTRKVTTMRWMFSSWRSNQRGAGALNFSTASRLSSPPCRPK